MPPELISMAEKCLRMPPTSTKLADKKGSVPRHNPNEPYPPSVDRKFPAATAVELPSTNSRGIQNRARREYRDIQMGQPPQSLRVQKSMLPEQFPRNWF